MKKVKYYMSFLITTVLLAVSGCDNQVNDLANISIKEKVIITATTASGGAQTRTNFEDEGKNGVKQYWAANDKFDLYTLEGKYAATFELNGAAGGSSGQFIMIEGESLTVGTTYTAVYPSIANTPTLESRAHIINGKTQTGNKSLAHIGDHCYMNAQYTHSEDGKISFKIEYVLFTIKMESLENYNPAIHGKPVNLTFFNGNNTTSLALEGISDWNETIIAYMLIKPIEGAGRQLRFDLLCENDYLFQGMLTSSKDYMAGRRYTANLAGNDKLVLIDSYTIEELEDIPEDLNTWVITDAVDANTGLSDLRDKLRGVVRPIWLVLPNATSIGLNAFYIDNNNPVSSLVSVSLPKAETIGNGAFRNCAKLESVSFPVAKTIGNTVFQDCKALTVVDLPAATKIGSSVFRLCSNLFSVSFPVAEVVGDNAFRGCASLLSVSLPIAKIIEKEALKGCSSSTSISLPMAEKIGDSAFDNCKLLTMLEIGTSNPEALVSVGATLFGTVNTKNIDLKVGTAESTYVDGETWRGYGPFKSITVK